MTLALPPQPTLNEVPVTTLAAAATARAIEELCNVQTEIKWVNDILLGGKKICGILAEKVNCPMSGEAKAVIVGVGVNLNNTVPEELADIAGILSCQQVSAEALARRITEELFSAIECPADYMAYYRKHSAVLGKEIYLITEKGREEARAIEIDDLGGLTVELANGETRTLTSGEITLRLKTDG